MPCPHNEITIVQRSQRQSAVAAAAYQSGEKLLSGDYGFLCQYDRSTGKDTVWSVIYDMKRHKIYRSEGNPRRHKFKEDIRFQF